MCMCVHGFASDSADAWRPEEPDAPGAGVALQAFVSHLMWALAKTQYRLQTGTIFLAPVGNQLLSNMILKQVIKNIT